MPDALLAAVPAAALVALAAAAALLARRGAARPTDIAWLLPPAAALAWVGIWCGMGLYEGGPQEVAALAASALAAGAVALLRGRALGAVDALCEARGLSRGVGRAAVTVVALALCSALALLALELPYNDLLSVIPDRLLGVELALLLVLLALLLFLFQRHGAGLALGAGLAWAVGLAQYFVSAFKGSAILPGDLLALGTAAAVSGSYVYSVDGPVLLGLACVMGACAAGSLVIPAPAATDARRHARVAANLGVSLAAALALVAGVTQPNYLDLGVRIDYWFTLEAYKKSGFLTSFVAVAQDMTVKVPEGYSDAEARELEVAYATTYDQTRGASPARMAAEAQYAAERPSVVCIMNETFSDLSIYDGASWGYTGPAGMNALADGLMGGSVAVSVLGGGTCNSEFEFLTGVSFACIGSGAYPYQTYDLSGAPSLPRQFSELGYDTSAIHPNLASNWSRDVVYEQLGFDRFYSIDDFEGAPGFHSGITDAATYDKVLEILEGSDDPQFVFDVTMQGHSPYDQDNIPPELLGGYSVDGFGDYDNGQLNEYLACIDAADRDLMAFLDALRGLDRPVVVVFFGDHQPYLSTALNGTLFGNEDPTSAEHAQRLYQTRYLVWANYDVAGSAQAGQTEATGLSYLAAMALEAAGVPLTDFQKAQLMVRETAPVLSSLGVGAADGSLVSLADPGSLPAAFEDLRHITYLEFATNLK